VGNLFGAQASTLAAVDREIHVKINHIGWTVYIPKLRRKWAAHVARISEMKNTYQILVEKSERRRSLGKHRYRWKNNIKMHLRQ
jgi:hypothetical protein